MISIHDYISNKKLNEHERIVAQLAFDHAQVLLDRQDLNIILEWLTTDEEGGNNLHLGPKGTFLSSNGKPISEQLLTTYVVKQVRGLAASSPEQSKPVQKAALEAIQNIAVRQVKSSVQFTDIKPELHLALLQTFIFDLLNSMEEGDTPVRMRLLAQLNHDKPYHPVTFSNPKDTDAHEAYREHRDQAITTKFYSRGFLPNTSSQ